MTKTKKQLGDGSEWLSDPEVIVFGTERSTSVGGTQKHSLTGQIGELFGRRKSEVQDDWDKVLRQMQEFLQRVQLMSGGYALEEISFELGFSAEGQIVFVAKAGVNTTIKATFRRS